MELENQRNSPSSFPYPQEHKEKKKHTLNFKTETIIKLFQVPPESPLVNDCLLPLNKYTFFKSSIKNIIYSLLHLSRSTMFLCLKRLLPLNLNVWFDCRPVSLYLGTPQSAIWTSEHAVCYGSHCQHVGHNPQRLLENTDVYIALMTITKLQF